MTTIEANDVYADGKEDVKLVAVEEVSIPEGFRLLELYETDTGLNCSHYWCPIDEWQERTTKKVGEEKTHVVEKLRKFVEGDISEEDLGL